MKKIIPILAALALITSMPVSAVYAEEQASTAVTAEAADAVTVKDIAGKWMYYIADGGYTVDVCSKYSGYIDVDSDGNFTYTYFSYIDTDRPEEKGKVKISTEKKSDGTSVPAVFFPTGTASDDFGGYYHDDIIDIGNDKRARLVRSGYGEPEMDKMIEEKMNDFAFFYNLFLESREYDPDDTIEVDGYDYEFCRVKDQSIIGLLAELKALIERTASGQLKEDMLYSCDRRFREKDGILYVNPVEGSVYSFITEYGIYVTGKTENRFYLTSVLGTLGGYYRLIFTKTDGAWTISDLDYGYYGVNNSGAERVSAAYSKVSNLRMILDNLSKSGDQAFTDKITVDGVEYAKAVDQQLTPDYMEYWINKTCTGELRDSLLEECRRHIIEKDGVVYTETVSRVDTDIPSYGDMILLSAAPDSYRVSTANRKLLSDCGVFELSLQDDEWRISSYTLNTLPEEFLFRGYVSGGENGVYIMEEADASSRKIWPMQDGEQLDIFESGTPGWYKVNYDGFLGYVSADHIKKMENSDKIPSPGDLTLDGIVDSTDASEVLNVYAEVSTGGAATDTEKRIGDINKDGLVDSGDASLILEYYTYVSTGGTDTPEEFFA